MAAATIVCGTCLAAVPYGRLSCPACGSLLASVAGGRQMAVGAVTLPAEAAGVAEDVAAPRDPSWLPAKPAGLAELMPEVDRAGEARIPAPRPRSTAFAGPGAYVPPLLGPARQVGAAGAAAPARAWAGRTSTPDPAPQTPPSTAASDTQAETLHVTEFVGWLSVAGSALSAVGFLLPWSTSMIGASGVGYFDRWGLAGPYHSVLVLGLLVVLVLALVRNPIPTWIRVGLPGLGLGALLIGLLWPYVISLAGVGPGALIVLVGALFLLVAGIVALASDRHGGADRAV